jgi:parallel beta-helix repeat protein
MKKEIPIVVGITILFLGTCITPSVAIDNVKKSSIPISTGNTLYVGGTGEGNYTKIQDAIDNASDGDTVFVFDDSSPYYENISIIKSINLLGEDKDTTIVDGNGNSHVIRVIADNIIVSGFTIQNSHVYQAGIYISDSYNEQDNTIEGNIISDNNIGILLRDSCKNTIRGNTISNNKIGILLSPYIFFNARLHCCRRNIIIKNNILDNELNALFEYTLFNGEFPLNRWNQNYWNRPRILPKIIIGILGFTPWINIDWNPNLKPYDI